MKHTKFPYRLHLKYSINVIVNVLINRVTRIFSTIALRLQYWFGRLSRLSQHICVIFFLLIGATIFTKILASSIRIRSPVQSQFMIVEMPNGFIRNQIKSPLEPIELEFDTLRIRKFRSYLDSLGASPAGLIIHDSIIQSRPGLVDSLVKIEKFLHLKK